MNGKKSLRKSAMSVEKEDTPDHSDEHSIEDEATKTKRIREVAHVAEAYSLDYGAW